jgi:hypothetical protein
MENRRLWSAYVCPACRLVFKYPDNEREQGVACPACLQVLQIPELNSTEFAFMPDKRDLEGVPEKKIRKRHKNPQRDGQNSWENEKKPKLVRKGQRKHNHTPMLIAGFVLSICLLVWLSFFILGTDKRENAPSAAPNTSVKVIEPAPSSASNLSKPDTEAPHLEENSPTINEAENLARKFLAAQTVEELRGLIRHPEVSIPRIMKLHPDGRINLGGLRKFNPSEQIRQSGNLISTTVRTNELDERLIVFIITPEGVQIDWESWEGWCEMSWQEFMSTRPAEGKIFRVKLNDTNYYNFDFSNESKWISYTLLSRDEQHQIYGYIERNSALEPELAGIQKSSDRFLTLSLKFPPNSTSNNQVIIERIVSDGWVTLDTPSP